MSILPYCLLLKQLSRDNFKCSSISSYYLLYYGLSIHSKSWHLVHVFVEKPKFRLSRFSCLFYFLPNEPRISVLGTKTDPIISREWIVYNTKLTTNKITLTECFIYLWEFISARYQQLHWCHIKITNHNKNATFVSENFF